jgi:hypothetical protein
MRISRIGPGYPEPGCTELHRTPRAGSRVRWLLSRLARDGAMPRAGLGGAEIMFGVDVGLSAMDVRLQQGRGLGHRGGPGVGTARGGRAPPLVRVRGALPRVPLAWHFSLGAEATYHFQLHESFSSDTTNGIDGGDISTFDVVMRVRL